jgi:cytochrome c556
LGGLAAASPPDVNAIRAQGQILAQVAGQLPGLFPAGSGPDSGTPTRASPAIWTNAAGFSEQVRNFNTAAQAVANASTPEAAAAAARGVGAACQSCHSQFRTQ